MSSIALVCPRCDAALVRDGDALRCASCDVAYPIDGFGIADFAQGEYYDHFDATTELTAEHRVGLELELDGTRRRIVDFYEPLMRRFAPDARTVLDCGCGNGLSVDLLNEHGYDAWGNDVSQLRKWQWRERGARERLVVASGMMLPFADAAFDVVLSSGVIEHIGVDEASIPRYRVAPRADRDAQRAAFLRELLRVTKRGGQLFLDAPNGAFPIDFWHGDAAGGARMHSRAEGFLPKYGELRALVREVAPNATIEVLSPYKRLQFRQAHRHWYGRLFAPLMALLFRAMTLRPLRSLAATGVNPFLVVRIAK